jgi:diguanylate cyclase (GGDEF)-like protein
MGSSSALPDLSDIFADNTDAGPSPDTSNLPDLSGLFADTAVGTTKPKPMPNLSSVFTGPPEPKAKKRPVLPWEDPNNPLVQAAKKGEAMPTAEAEQLGPDPGTVMPAARQAANLAAGWVYGIPERLGMAPEGTYQQMQSDLNDERQRALEHGHEVAQTLAIPAGLALGMVPSLTAAKVAQGGLAAAEVAAPSLARKLAGVAAAGGEGALQGGLQATGESPEDQAKMAALGAVLGSAGASGRLIPEGRFNPSTAEPSPTAPGPGGSPPPQPAPAPAEVSAAVDVPAVKSTADMTHAELRAAFLTSEKTGLPNRRAFDEVQTAQPKPVVVLSDVDGLKYINDSAGHDTGDQLLKLKADAYKAAGVDAYHAGGDEFIARFDSPEQASAAMAQVKQHLGNAQLDYSTPDGQVRLSGVGFSYGAGSDLASADAGLRAAKEARLVAGERAPRGEPPPNLGRVPQPDAGGVEAGIRPAVSEDAATVSRPIPPDLRAAAAARAAGALTVEPPAPPEPPLTTSLKNAVAGAERADRGLPPVEHSPLQLRGDQAILDAGKSAVENGSVDPRALAQSIVDKPRGVSVEEGGALAYDRMRLANARQEVQQQVFQAQDAGQPVSPELRQKLASIQDAYDVNDQAIHHAGTAWSDIGNFRQRFIKQDYSLAQVMSRAKAATPDGVVPEQAASRLAQTDRLLQTAQTALDEHTQGLGDRELNRSVARMQRYAKRSSARAATAAQLDAEFEEMRGRFRAAAATPRAGLDPELVGQLGEMAFNRVRRGVNTAAEVVDHVYQAVKDHIDGITPRDVRDAISGYGKTSQPSTDPVAAKARDLRAQMRLISSLEDAQAGQEPLRSGFQHAPASPEVQALRKQVMDAMRANGIRDPQAQSLQAYKTKIQNQIAKMEGGDFSTPQRRPLKLDAEAQALRTKAQALRAKAAPQTGDSARIQARKAAMLRQAKQLESNIARMETTGKKPAPVVRKPIPLDQEGLALQAKVETLRARQDAVIRQLDRKNRGGLSKAGDFAVGLRRAVLLSSPRSLGKIASSAVFGKMAARPAEELAGAFWSKLPGIREIAAKAPTEGSAGLRATLRGEGSALGQIADPETYRDIGRTLKTGAGVLDSKRMDPGTGEKFDPQSVASFFGRAHGAMKVLPQRAEFMRARSRLIDYYGAHPELKVDPSTAEGSARIIEEAKAKSLEAKFQQPNVLHTAFHTGIAQLKKAGGGYEAAAHALEFLMPMTHIASNIATEGTDYAAGPAKAMLQILRSRGVDKMTPEQADYVMRNIKKGTVGWALGGAVMGHLIKAGGFYQEGDRRKPGDLPADTVSIGGVQLPRWLTGHLPIASAIQVAQELRKNPNAQGVLRAANGIAQELPYYEMYNAAKKGVAGEGYGAPNQVRRDYWGDIGRSTILPPDLPRVARVQDQKTGKPATTAQLVGLADADPARHRYAQTIAQEFKLGIPGYRKQVPATKPRATP